MQFLSHILVEIHPVKGIESAKSNRCHTWNCHISRTSKTNILVKKKGRKAEPETVTADLAVKKQEEFEAMKKKTRNMLLGLVAVIVVAVAGIAAYKAMH